MRYGILAPIFIAAAINNFSFANEASDGHQDNHKQCQPDIVFLNSNGLGFPFSWSFTVAAGGPGILILVPAGDSVVELLQPVISGSFIDNGHGVDPSSFVLNASFPYELFVVDATCFWAMPKAGLTPGIYFVNVSIANYAGVTQDKSWFFTVSANATGPVYTWRAIDPLDPPMKFQNCVSAPASTTSIDPPP